MDGDLTDIQADCLGYSGIECLTFENQTINWFGATSQFDDDMTHCLIVGDEAVRVVQSVARFGHRHFRPLALQAD